MERSNRRLAAVPSLLCLGTLALALGFSPPASAQAQVCGGADQDGDGVPDLFDAFPQDPKASAATFAPSMGNHAMVLYEDMWPMQGDLDFNDSVITYNYIYGLTPTGRVGFIRATFNALAVGATLPSSLLLHLPVPATSIESITRRLADGTSQTVSPLPADSELVFPVAQNTRDFFAGAPDHINSRPELPVTQGTPIEINIRFSSPIQLDTGAAPYDLFFSVGGDRHQIHRPEYAGTATMDRSLFHTGDDGSGSQRHYVDQDGLPFVLIFPQLTLWPREGVSIDRLYPGIVGFASSGGTQNRDFYAQQADSAQAFLQGSDGQPPPSPGFLSSPNAPNASFGVCGIGVGACAPGYSLGFGGYIPDRGSYVPSIEMAPCQKIAFTATAKATSDRYGAAVAVDILSLTGVSLAYNGFATYASPGTANLNSWGMLQPAAHPGALSVKSSIWSFNYTAGAVIEPRDTIQPDGTLRAYNMAGISLDSPLSVEMPIRLGGSLPDDGTHTYQIYLDNGQTVYLSGYVTGNTRYGVAASVKLYNSARAWVATPVNVASYGTTQINTSYTNRTGAGQVFVLEVHSGAWTLQDYQLSLEKSTL